MGRLARARKYGAVAMVAVATASAAHAAAPSGTITFSGGAVAFIAGVNWGGGHLHYRGQSIPVKVSGLSVGAIGVDKFQAKGTVYNLHKVGDIQGTYAAIGAGATVGGGAGLLEMKNGNGVVIKAQSTSLGLHLKLGPSGMSIKLK